MKEHSMKKAAPALLLATLCATSCYDIEQTLTLERNLSGKAGFSMKIDMSPMAVFMAKMAREMEGKPGEPTAAEIEKVRKEMLSDDKPMDPVEFAKDRKELETKLPPGVKLLDATFTEQGLGFAMGLAFAFDHPSKLAKIEFPKEPVKAEGPPMGPPKDNPIDHPFGGLTVTDQGATILVTSPPQNPVADQMDPKKEKPSPEEQKMIDQLFKGLRVAFKITAPFTIVEHNAHRKEGTTLIWEYTLKSLEKMTAAELNQSIKVRYRK
jgi:hypothetical protein